MLKYSIAEVDDSDDDAEREEGCGKQKQKQKQGGKSMRARTYAHKVSLKSIL